MKKRNLIIIVLALTIIVAVSSRRETVGNDETAARTSIFGTVSVYGPGDKPFIIPGIYKLLRFRAEPVTINLIGDAAVAVRAGETRKEVECQVTYRLIDPAALIKRFGTDPPGEKVKTEIIKIITGELARTARTDKDFMATVPSRVLLTAGLLDTLSRKLTPAGIKPESLNLRLRKVG